MSAIATQDWTEARQEWEDVKKHLRHVAEGTLRENALNLTALDQHADDLERVANHIRQVVASGTDPVHLAAVALAEASTDPDKVHGELVFDPRPLDDAMVDLPIGGEWHPRSEVAMTTTALAVVVPRPLERKGEPKPGTADWRASCRTAVQAALDYHRHLLREGLLPGEDA